MQQSIPFKTWTTPSLSNTKHSTPIDARKLATQNALIIFGRRGCCMCHVVKQLMVTLGVNPAVHEVDEEEESELVRELTSLRMVVDLNQKSGCGTGTEHRFYDDEMMVVVTLPVVFVGGNLFGGLERVMTTHISGELVPVLKRAGALWL